MVSKEEETKVEVVAVPLFLQLLKKERPNSPGFSSTTKSRIESLQQMRTISDIIVAAVVTMGVELVISWNNISGVNDVNNAAQLIPLVISAAYTFRSIYQWISGSPRKQTYYDGSPYLTSGIGGSGTYSDGGGGTYDPRIPVYMGTSRDWPGRRHHSQRHHRNRARRSSRVDPSMMYEVPNMMRHQDVSTARAQHEPTAMNAASSRHATAVDAPDEIYAADNGAAERGPTVSPQSCPR